MTDLTTQLASYLIEDHRLLSESARSAAVDVTALRDEIARWQGAAEGWKKEHDKLTATIAALQGEIESWRASNASLTKELATARDALAQETERANSMERQANPDRDSALKFATKAHDTWDSDPEASMQALERTIHALGGQSG